MLYSLQLEFRMALRMQCFTYNQCFWQKSLKNSRNISCSSPMTTSFTASLTRHCSTPLLSFLNFASMSICDSVRKKFYYKPHLYDGAVTSSTKTVGTSSSAILICIAKCHFEQLVLIFSCFSVRSTGLVQPFQNTSYF